MSIRRGFIGTAFAALVLVGAGTPTVARAVVATSPDDLISNTGQILHAPPASEAAGGGFSGSVGSAPNTESVIGADGRTQVTATTTYPSRAIAMVTRNGSQWCTAEFVGKDVLLTAGHCVHSGGSGGAFYASSSFKFYPGRNGSSSPYGYCSARSAGLYTFSGWANSADEKHDLGFIKLSCTKGTTVGTFGFWWQTASEAGLPATVRGYPGDKPAGTLWTMDGTISTSQQYQNFYLNDTFGGQSGSPVYQNRKTGSSYCAGYCIHTNHSYGVHGSTAPHSNQNHGRRITQAASDLIIQLKNQA